MSKKIYPGVFIIFLLALGQNLSGKTSKTPHQLGLIYQNPQNVPWLIEVKPQEIGRTFKTLVDHSSNMPPVGNQGAQGSCVGWAFAYYYKTYQEWVEHNWDVTDTHHQFSPAFMYNQINAGIDGGSFFADAMKLLCDLGCANLYDAPYSDTDYTTWPSETAYYNAIRFRSDSAYYIYVGDTAGINALKAHIAGGDNAVIGILVWGNFDNINNYDTTFCVSDTTGSIRGGHAQCIVGYDDSKSTNDGVGAFRVVNSWGTGWGNNGYYWMSYQAVMHPRTSYLYAYYTTDKVGYSPEMEMRVKISHPRREWIEITAGIGADASPQWTKNFLNWYIYQWWTRSDTGHPFPNNNIVLDISDGMQYLDPYDTNNVFVKCIDDTSDATTGTIQYLSSVNNNWGAFSKSSETPKTTPDYSTPAYANLGIPTQKLQWQSFHRLPDNSGITALAGNMDSVRALWSYTTAYDVSSSPVLGDIDGDGKLEAILGSGDSIIYALNGEDGSLLWSYKTGGWVESSPALGDIDGDGKLEVVVGSDDYKIYALNGEDGSLLWSYTTGSPVFSSPALGDIDGDGKLEVVVGSNDNKIYALNGEDGSLLWSYTTGNYVYSSPALGDIDGDGKLEIVFGSNDSTVYALNGEDGSLLWSYTTGYYTYSSSSPALGDIDGDGKLEVVFSSWDNKIYALNGEDGLLLWSYSTGSDVKSSPALGDIDGDGKLEIVFGSNDHKIYALNGEDGSFLWSYSTGSDVKSSPALGDIDGDGKLEVVVGSHDNKIYTLNGEDGSLLWSYTTGGWVWSSPALGDIDGDGKLEVVVGSYDNKIYALNGEFINLNSPDGGESWVAGDTQTIKWTGEMTNIDHIRILFSTDAGTTYADTIANSISYTDTTYNWIVPSINSTTCRVKTQLLDGNNYLVSEDESNANFTITLSGIKKVSPIVPRVFSISEVYPNPFVKEIYIRYGIPEDADVKIEIYNLAGQKITSIVDGHRNAGYYKARWNGKNGTGKTAASGIYFIHFRARKWIYTRKVVFVK